MSLPLRAYQTEGASWIYDRLSEPDTRAVLLADEPGLGKTLQALEAARRLKCRRILVIAPAGGRRVWAQEIQKWFPAWSSRVLVIEPGVQMGAVKDQLDQDSVIVLLSYDVLSQSAPTVGAPSWTSLLTRRRWDLLVLDEAHYLKNPSNRTLAIYGMRDDKTGLQAACTRVILLTGTPAPNHLGELWFHLRTLFPQTLLVPDRRTGAAPDAMRRLTQAEYEEQVTDFRDTRWGRQIVRSKNQAWLRDRLKPYFLRRTKARVLPELPALVVQDIPLAVRQPVLDTSPVAQWLIDASDIGDDALLAALSHVPQEDLGALATLRRQLGEMKVDATLEWVEERLACGTRKLILFGWHVSVLQRIFYRLAVHSPVLVTGATPPAERSRSIDRFQTDPECRVFVGQILAAGTAITLTAASEVAILEPSWVPGENVQAIDRAHRLGQRDSVLASFLFVPDTLDERIMRVFRRKALEINELTQGDETNDAQGGNNDRLRQRRATG